MFRTLASRGLSLFSSAMKHSPVRYLLATTLFLGSTHLSMAAPALKRAHPAYEPCLAQIDTNPQAAFEQASQWKSQTGEAAAEHCEALALVKIGLVKEGAKILEKMAANDTLGSINLRAEIFMQAAEAWRQVPDLGRAFSALAAAFALNPDKPWIKTELFVARAKAQLQSEAFEAAEKDLSYALDILPFHLDAVVLRASARRELSDPVGALADIEFVLAADPENPEAFLERGLLKKKFYDPEGAQADLQRVIQLAPQSKAAATARNTLNVLSIRDQDE